MGWRIEVARTLRDPRSNPPVHLVELHGGFAEPRAQRPGVAKQCYGRFSAVKLRRFVKQRAKAVGRVAHGKDLGSTEIVDGRWRGAEREGANDHVVRVALPDAIKIAVSEIDRRTSVNLLRNVNEHTVTKLDSVEEAQLRHRSFLRARVEVKNALAANGSIAVLAERR